jgi:thioredoxin reductase (NADPH)
MNKPALLVVDDDAQVLAAVRRDLRGKYRESYTIIGATSGEEALATVRELKARGDELAMVVSDQRMPGMQGTDVLAGSLEIYPLAKRVLLTAYSEIDAAVKAINVARLDYYLAKPWDPPDERLFPVVDELLDQWQIERPLEEKGLRLIGNQWSPRSHAIKDFLAANLIPYRWLDVVRNPEARSLLDATGIADRDLPALVFEDGSKLINPEPRQVAWGNRWRPRTTSTISSLSGPARRVSRRRCTARQRGCARCCSISMRPAGRRAPARG